MKRGILLTSTNTHSNYDNYPIKVIIFDTPEEALIEFERLELELDNTEPEEWYVYPTLIEVEVN